MTTALSPEHERMLSDARKRGEAKARHAEMVQILKELIQSTSTLIVLYREAQTDSSFANTYCDLLDLRLEMYQRRLRELEVEVS